MDEVVPPPSTRFLAPRPGGAAGPSSSSWRPTWRRRRTFYYILVGLVVEGCFPLLFVRDRCQREDDRTATSPPPPSRSSSMCWLTTVLFEGRSGTTTAAAADTEHLLMGAVVGASLHRRRHGRSNDDNNNNNNGMTTVSSTPQPPQRRPGTAVQQQEQRITAPAAGSASSASSSSSTTTTSTAFMSSNPTATTSSMPDEEESEFASIFYSPARVDRAGATIHDMLLALSYGFANNITYKGACYERGMKDDVFTVKAKAHPQDHKQLDKESLIEVLGLHDVLVFACPPKRLADTLLLRPDLYRNRNTSQHLLNPNFLTWVRSKSKTVGSTTAEAAATGSSMSTATTTTLSAVVHVRRGDIDPCHYYKNRYLPNSYYVDVVRQHVPVDVPVTIFSESASFEPFDDLVEALQHQPTAATNATDGGHQMRRNVTLLLDTDPVDVWEAMLGATHIVMSFSAFSYVPALLNVNSNSATVVVPPNWDVDVPSHWILADIDIKKRMNRRVQELAAQSCEGYVAVKPRQSFDNSTRRKRRRQKVSMSE